MKLLTILCLEIDHSKDYIQTHERHRQIDRDCFLLQTSTQRQLGDKMGGGEEGLNKVLIKVNKSHSMTDQKCKY